MTPLGTRLATIARTMMFCDRHFGQGVDAAYRANEETLSLEAKQGFPGNP